MRPHDASARFAGNLQNRTKRILIIGAGAGGSYLVHILSKEGYTNIIVYDHDTVESHNVGTQMYSGEYIGKKKAEALADYCVKMGGVPIEYKNEEFNMSDYDHATQLEMADIVVCAADTMSFRSDLWERIKSLPYKYLIDMRASAFFGDTYCISTRELSGSLATEYEGRLYSDAEAVQTACSQRSVPHLTMMQAALSAGLIERISSDAYYNPPFHFNLDMKALMWEVTHVGSALYLSAEVSKESIKWIKEVMDEEKENEEEGGEEETEEDGSSVQEQAQELGVPIQEVSEEELPRDEEDWRP